MLTRTAYVVKVGEDADGKPLFLHRQSWQGPVPFKKARIYHRHSDATVSLQAENLQGKGAVVLPVDVTLTV